MPSQTNRHLWTIEEDHYMLETVLPADGAARFARACDQVARQMQRGQDLQRANAHAVLTGDLVRRRLWGLATRLALYTPHTEPRTSRRGPLLHTERIVVHWAIYNKSQEAKASHNKWGAPDAPYIALLLARPAEDVERAWKILGPAKGRKGFGI